MSDTLTFKRGSTFTATATWTPVSGGLANLSGCTVTSDIKDYLGTLRPLTVSVDGTNLIVTLTATAAETIAWNVGEAKWDIRVKEAGGTVFYTETKHLSILSEITPLS